MVHMREPRRAAGDAGTCAVVIEFHGVGKRYTSLWGKQVRAVRDFTLRIEAGEVLGIAGPNGAGKSTLLNLLLGYLNPTEGEVRISGLKPRTYVERRGIGYLSELISIPPGWTTVGALRRYATLAGVPGNALNGRVDAVIDMLGLHEHRAKHVKALSKGNLQRLGLGQALLREDVEVLVLDEPTHGLDPVWTQRFRDLVQEQRRPNRAILLASHNLDELARVADRVAIIDGGRLQRVVDLRGETAVATGAVRYRLLVAGEHDGVLAHFPGAVDAGRGELEVTADSLDALNTQVAGAIRAGARFTSITPAHSALEQQFREAVKNS